jgi:hypothetical protein
LRLENENVTFIQYTGEQQGNGMAHEEMMCGPVHDGKKAWCPGGIDLH